MKEGVEVVVVVVEGRRQRVRREQQAAQSYPKGTEIMDGFYRYN